MNQIGKLYSNGMTMKEVAKRVNRSVTYVKQVIDSLSWVDDNFIKLVKQCVLDLKNGNICYCFTTDHIQAIKKRFPYFEPKDNGVGYTLTPPANNYFKMKETMLC